MHNALMSSAAPIPAVLLHGQVSTSAVWLPVQQQLSGISTYAPDRPGYGVNSGPALDFGGNIDWLIHYLDECGLERVVLVGHSWAGGLALLAAVRHPARIAGLVLVASIGPECLLWTDRPLAWPVVGELAAIVGLKFSRPAVRYRIRHDTVDPMPIAEKPYAQMEMAAQLTRPLWRSFLVEQRALISQLSLVDGSLSQIAVPTTVLAGTRDTVVKDRTAQQLADRIPGAQLRWIANGSHLLPVEAAGEVAQAIRDLTAKAK